MHGYISSPSNEQTSKVNTFSTEAYIDSLAYSIWVPPSSLIITDTTAPFFTATNQYPSMVFPEGKTGGVFYAFRKPKMWIDGWATARIHWTGIAEVAKYYYLYFGIASTSGDTTTTSTIQLPVIQNFQVASPPVSTSYCINRYPETGPIGFTKVRVNQNTSFINLRLGRQGGHASDTATTDFELLGIELLYVEILNRVSWKYNPDYNAVSAP